MSFEQALRFAGLRPRSSDIKADGVIRRCPTESKPGKRNGWFVLHPDGHGSWGDWGSGGGEALGHWKDEHAKVDAAAVARMAEQTRQQRERERAHRLQAMRSARTFWAAARPLNRPHKYIADKGLSPLGCASLRTHDGLLVVPVWLGEWLISVQTITADGAKRFWPGAPVKAGCLVLDRQRPAVTVVCEGLATGLAVFQSMRQARVVVAFDAGNLLPVVGRLKLSGSVVIGADNDHATLARRGFNPGLDKARNAAELIGCGVAYPTGIEGSDWADFLKELGEGSPRKLERAVLAQARYVMEPVP
jgi:putative DNA primase/helicase